MVFRGPSDDAVKDQCFASSYRQVNIGSCGFIAVACGERQIIEKASNPNAFGLNAIKIKCLMSPFLISVSFTSLALFFLFKQQLPII